MAGAQVVSREVGEYLDHISAYEREFKQWTGRVRKLVKKYRMDDQSDKSPDRFNILWSNVQTLKAATYARMPRPDVSRRFKDNDPVARVAGLLLERALEFEVETYNDFQLSMLHVVYDRFLGGRGTAWVRYHPVTKELQLPDVQMLDEGESQITEDEETETATQEVLDYETTPVDYVHWEDFGHNVARTWEEVSIVWRKVFMTREAAVKRFGKEVGKKLPMDATPGDNKRMDDSEGVEKRGLVYEIWDKEKGRAFWLSKSMGEFLDEREDPLQIDGFFPCPRPIYSTLTPDSLVPVPDYTFYQDQAVKLDDLSNKISGLIEALKIVGVYDASVPEIVRMFKEGVSGDLIPVQNWQAFAEKKGLSGAIDIVDVQPIASALKDAYEAFEQVKGHIYELTGISDIIRGQSAVGESATAQQIKSNYASLRLKVYQDEVERFASDIFRIKAEIICRHFDEQTFIEMSGARNLQPVDQQMIPQAIALLRDNVHRKFRIAVETDSMAYQDEQQEKKDRVEFLQATAQFIQQVEQAAQNVPQLLPLGIELLKFGVGGFKVGKTLEGVIDSTAEQMKQVAAQQAQKPNPEMMKMQAEQQMQSQKLQQEGQLAQVKMQQDAQLEQVRASRDIEIGKAKAQADMQLAAQQAQLKAQSDEAAKAHEAQLQQLEMQMKERLEAQKMELDRYKIEMDYRKAIEVAEINAAATLQSAQAQAAMQAAAGQQVSDDQDKQKTDNAARDKKLDAVIDSLSRPKKIVRDKDGRVAGVE